MKTVDVVIAAGSANFITWGNGECVSTYYSERRGRELGLGRNKGENALYHIEPHERTNGQTKQPKFGINVYEDHAGSSKQFLTRP